MGVTQAIMTFLAVVTLGIGLLLSQRNMAPKVLSEADEFPTDTPHSTTNPSTNPTTLPISTPSATTIPKPTSTPRNDSTDFGGFLFPNATILSVSGNTATLSSNSNPEEIFVWYQNIFKSRNLNAISSSKTVVNGNFLAKLAGSNGVIKIEIEIKKEVGQSSSVIALKLTLS